MAALLWDVDGTLAETERDGHRVAFNLAFEARGLDWHWSPARYGELLSVVGGRERLLADMATRVDAPPEPLACAALAAELHAIKNERYAELVRQGRIPLRAGVAALMEQAHTAGLAQAVVTTTSRVNVDALFGVHFGPGWQDRFAAVVCGEDVRRKKPDPEAYAVALARLGLPAARTLALEDSPPGLAAARAAGVPVLLVRSRCFADGDATGALASGPGLDRRHGWRPAPRPGAGAIGLADLVQWHAGHPAAL